jgi:hypothetical protein
MEQMNITSAQYITGQGGSNVAIKFTLDGREMSVPLGADGNVHYEEIMRQVEAGTLTIQDAE